LDPETFSTNPTSIEDAPVSEEDEEDEKIEPMAVSNAVELKERLKNRIEELRAARKQSDTPVHSRHELLEKRKLKKQERQKALQKKKDARKLDVDTKVFALDDRE
jgi:hypothetical protein